MIARCRVGSVLGTGTFPAAIASIEPPGTGYHTLEDFDTYYAENMDPWNYG